MPTTSPTGAPDTLLQDYLRPVLSRKWLILGVVVLVVAATYAYYARQPKQYAASTSIFVANQDNALTLLDPTYATYGNARDTTNKAALILSRDVASRVARKIRFKRNPGELLGSVRASPNATADFISVSATRPSAQEAADVANAFAQEFIDQGSQRRKGVAQQALARAQSQYSQIPKDTANQEARAAAAQNVRRLQLVIQLPTGNTVQLDSATPPASPFTPRPRRNAIFAFGLSLIAAIALAFGLERFDRRLKRIDDIENLYGLPIIAVVPHGEDLDRREEGESVVERTIREPMRQLRTNLELASLDRPLKRVLITSAIPGEGKSTVVRNLAIVYREWGQRVTVVDGDLRRPSLPKLFGLDPDRKGLTDVLTGTTALEEALTEIPVHVRGLKTLQAIQDDDHGAVITDVGTAAITLLPAGTSAANPQAVLASARTASLLDDLAADCDIMLIDSPPTLAVSDSVSLMAHVDAVVLVVRLDHTVKDTARLTLESLERVPDVKIVGVVVNDLTSFEGGNYRYGYYRQYGDAS